MRISSESAQLLGVHIDCLHLPELLGRVAEAALQGRRLVVMYVHVHSMNLAHDPDFRETLNAADIVYCDGTGVKLGAAILGVDIPERMTGADWIHDLCRTAIRHDLSLYFLGSAPGVADAAATALSVRYPGLKIAGYASGYGVTGETVEAINASRADIILVGMGSPSQERWVLENRDRLEPPVLWCVGALFEFVSGRVRRGPRWLTDNGFEWLCRLAVEPRKLWKRYLIGNPVFFARVLGEWVRRRRLLRPSGRDGLNR